MRNERLNFILMPIIIISLVVGLASCGQNGNVGTASTSAVSTDSSAASTGSSAASKEVKSNDELYNAAVRDAVFIEDDEILPLVNISKDDENVLWDDKGRVLVAFMHKYPDSYPTGEDIELKWGNVWCVPAKEMCKWVQKNGEGVTDWTTRLHQVLGMPTSKEYNTVTAIWVDAKLLYRPANVSDPNAKMEVKYKATGDEAFDKKFKEFFDGNIVWSYFDSAFPWTRLGYTYDWADNGTDYGLSEFLIFNGAKAKVEYTYNVEDYVAFAKKFDK